DALPALAGRAVNGSYCGMTMVQHDAQGDVLFLHRNQHKLTGMQEYRLQSVNDTKVNISVSEALGAPQSDKYPDPVIWTHLMTYRAGISSKFYWIDAYRAAPQFPQWQPCYGRRHIDKARHFDVEEFSNLSFAGIETNLRRYAMEAAQLRQAQDFTRKEVRPTNITDE
ncbi:hypothetical protein G195_011561, partial [Phytophthora kernoviae 00238/432]